MCRMSRSRQHPTTRALARRDVLGDLGIQECKRIIETKLRAWESRQQDCWLWFGSTDEDGYVRQLATTRTGAKAFYWLHQIAFVLRNNRNVRQWCSHRCGKKNCFNPKHLVDEPYRISITRNCEENLYCGEHQTPSQSDCTHNPPCTALPAVCCCDQK